MDGTELKRLEDNFATLALHSGYVPRNWSNMPVVAPLVTSVSYKHVKPGHYSVIIWMLIISQRGST